MDAAMFGTGDGYEKDLNACTVRRSTLLSLYHKRGQLRSDVDTHGYVAEGGGIIGAE